MALLARSRSAPGAASSCPGRVIPTMAPRRPVRALSAAADDAGSSSAPSSSTAVLAPAAPSSPAPPPPPSPSGPGAQNSAVPATLELQARMTAASRSRRAELDAEAAERARLRALEDAGVKWWQVPGPSNMVLCCTPLEVAAACEAAAAAGRLAVLCVFSEGCYACRSLAPKLRQIAEAHAATTTFVKVNGTAPEGGAVAAAAADGGGGGGGGGGNPPDADLGAWARSALGVDRLPWFMVYAPGDWEAGRPASSFTASLRPEKLALLRREIERHAASVPAAAAAAAVPAAR